MAPIDAATSILHGLRGKQILVPDLRPIYAGWRVGVNPHYQRLVPILNGLLESIVPNKKRREAYKKTDFALFTARCYPTAEWDRLRTLGMFFVWIFLWDDEIDKEIDPDVLDCASDYRKANEYRSESAVFIGHQLSRNAKSYSKVPVAPTEVCAAFGLVAPIFVKVGEQICLERLTDDLQVFMMSSAAEQKCRLTGELPNVEDYWKFRIGTGGVDAICTLHQYLANTHLPDELAWAKEVEIMRYEVSKQTIMSNDLLSLKKEIAAETLSGLVPIMLHHTDRPLEWIVSDVVRQLYESARSFKDAVARLRRKGEGWGVEIRGELDRFIESFETFQSGCFYWYIASKRYGVKQYEQADGSFLIDL